MGAFRNCPSCWCSRTTTAAVDSGVALAATSNSPVPRSGVSNVRTSSADLGIVAARGSRAHEAPPRQWLASANAR